MNTGRCKHPQIATMWSVSNHDFFPGPALSILPLLFWGGKKRCSEVGPHSDSHIHCAQGLLFSIYPGNHSWVGTKDHNALLGIIQLKLIVWWASKHPTCCTISLVSASFTGKSSFSMPPRIYLPEVLFLFLEPQLMMLGLLLACWVGSIWGAEESNLGLISKASSALPSVLI